MLKSPDAEYGTKEEESVTFYNVGPDKRMSQVNVLYVKRNCT